MCVLGAQGARIPGRASGAQRRCAPPHSSTTTNASAGRASRRVRTAARAALSRSAACSVFLRLTKAGDGAIQGGARHGAVGMLPVPPGGVDVACGVGRRFEAGAQHVRVVLIEAWRTAWCEGRSRARRARPAFDAGQTDGEGRGHRTVGHPLLDGGNDSFTRVKSTCAHTDS